MIVEVKREKWWLYFPNTETIFPYKTDPFLLPSGARLFACVFFVWPDFGIFLAAEKNTKTPNRLLPRATTPHSPPFHHTPKMAPKNKKKGGKKSASDVS